MSENASIISSRDRDCMSCRIVSGSGLIGAGIYIAYHSKNLKKANGKYTLLLAAAASMGLGVTRIFDLPPFRNKFNQNIHE